MNYKEFIDYSSLSTYLECPRKFYFQYILHFRSVRPSIHLVFGSAWHYGLEKAYELMMEEPTTPLTPTDLRETSISGFNQLWTIEGEPHFDPDIVFPKNPGRAADMYDKYWKKYLNEDLEYRIIGVESPFAIDLSSIYPGLPAYIGRLDLISESPSQELKITDHKTASSINKVTSTQFQSSMQTDGYLCAGHMYYDKIPTMEYSVSLCQKTKIAFERFSFSKRNSALDRFLHDLCEHSANILLDLQQLESESHIMEKTYSMNSFLRKPGYACTAYFSPCPYFDICNARNNPMTWKDDPPQGYDVNEWDPTKHEEETKKKLKEIA